MVASCLKLWLLAAALVAASAWFSSAAVAQYDPNAPCGRDDNGYPLRCAKPNPSADLEANCLTTGRVEICVLYHQNACQTRGFALACRLYQLGRNCFGGDPNQCNFYVALLRANTACSLDRNQSACAWLRQQQY